MYSRCLYEEQKDNANPVKIVSFAPGVVNTEMQEEIRNSRPEHFPELGRFVDMKESGKLLEAGFVAELMLKLLDTPTYGSQTVMHVNDLL
jgi:benzil reductase ((S)-benzoin forming)